MARVFLPGIGFRQPGLRLGEPVTERSASGRSVTITQLVSTADGSDLIYEVEWHGEQDVHSERDRVVMHGASTDPACRPGSMAVAVRQGKLVCTRSLPPVAAGITHVEIEISGDGGQWRVPLDLEPFGADEQQRRREVGASDSRQEVTITVDSITFMPDATVVEVRAVSERPGWRVSIGGLRGLRDETTALRLHHGHGRSYLERTRQDARDQFPDRFGQGDVGVFDPISDDAGALVLEVPYVCAHDHTTTSADIPLPVREPITVELAGAETRVRATRESELPGSRGSAIAVDLDVSTWYGDRRVIVPLGAKLDGQDAGISWGKGLHGPSPEPAPSVLVPCATPTEPHLLTFRGAFVQLRGPWRIPISVA
jgi:hypothetical protein